VARRSRAGLLALVRGEKGRKGEKKREIIAYAENCKYLLHEYQKKMSDVPVLKKYATIRACIYILYVWMGGESEREKESPGKVRYIYVYINIYIYIYIYVYI